MQEVWCQSSLLIMQSRGRLCVARLPWPWKSNLHWWKSFMTGDYLLSGYIPGILVFMGLSRSKWPFSTGTVCVTGLHRESLLSWLLLLHCVHSLPYLKRFRVLFSPVERGVHRCRKRKNSICWPGHKARCAFSWVLRLPKKYSVNYWNVILPRLLWQPVITWPGKTKRFSGANSVIWRQ